MRVCYLVWSYRDPAQVERLVRRLLRDDPAGAVVVRHDQHVTPLALDLPRTTVLPAGTPVVWAEFSQVESLLELFRAARAVDADWYVLLSGDDYPVRPLAQLPGHLEGLGADVLLEQTAWHEQVPGHRADQVSGRYRYVYAAVPQPFGRPVLPPGVRALALRVAQAVDRRTVLLSVRTRERGLPVLVGWRSPRHPFRHGLVPHKARNWFALDRRALLRVLDRLDADPALLRWFRRTFVPTEGLFATVLRSDPALVVADGDLHHELWLDGGSPQVLGAEDLPEAFASGAFFARKFCDPAVLDLLDARLDTWPGGEGGAAQPAAERKSAW